MTTMIFIGNLTKDAEVKTTKDGKRKYLLLQVAENIRQRDEQGNYVKDEQGHYISSQTLFHSVFFNKGNVLEVMDLKKGDPVKVYGTARIKIEKNASNYDQYILDRIVANHIETNPFGKEEALASDADVEAIPF